MVGLVDKPLINMESAINHPCQALADWKTLDDLAVPRRAQVRAVVGESSARAAAGRAGRHGAHGRACAAWKWWCCGRKDSRCRRPSCRKAAAAAAASGGSVRETADRDDALAGAHVLYAKEWGSTSHYGNAEADARARAQLADWCVRDTWFSQAAVGLQTHALPAGAA